MAATSVLPPFPHFKGLDGTPLNNGYVYIGDPGVDPETNPATIYWDLALGVTASQPVRTINGFYSNAGDIGEIYVNVPNFSITVRDSSGQLVFTKLNYELALPFSSFDYQPEATGSVSRDVTSKLSEIVSVKDFGAVGDSVTDDTAAFTLAEALSQNYIYLPAGTYIVTGITLTKEYWGPGQIELDSVLQDRLFDEVVRGLSLESDKFADSGAADAYVLTKTNGRPVTTLEDGLTVKWSTSNASTGGAATIAVDGISAAALTLEDGTNPAVNDVKTIGLNEAVYSLANTRFELQDPVSRLLSTIVNGSSITGNGYIRVAITPTINLIIQWGVNTASSGAGTTHSYPTPFTTSVYCHSHGCQNQLVSTRSVNTSLSQFVCVSASGTPALGWIAIGV